MNIRAAQWSDLPAITAIYNHYVRTSPCTFDIEPWSVESRGPWFERFDGTRWHCFVADEAGVIAGYGCSGEFKPKAAYRTSVEVSIYVAADRQRGGIATALYGALFPELVGRGVHRAYAGITLPNAASVALHRRFGFADAGLYREVGYKFDRYWDVMWMERAVD
jgi:phosphinothricin acetyltransferase